MGPPRVELGSPPCKGDVLPIDYRPIYKINIIWDLNLLLSIINKDKMFERSEEEIFVNKPKRSIDIDDSANMKVNSLVKKIDIMMQKMMLITSSLDYISNKVDKALDELVAYDRSLDEIESRINMIKSKISEMDALAPSVEIENVSGRDEAY